MANQIDRAKTRRLIASMIPADIAKRIDAEELEDRLAAAGRLLQRSRSAGSPTLATAYGEQARSLLAAQPRVKTQQEVRTLMVKAAQAGTADERERYRAAAERLRIQHPAAPRRNAAIIKVADISKLIPIYDANGELVGLCDPADIQPVEPITREAVTKAHAAKRRRLR